MKVTTLVAALPICAALLAPDAAAAQPRRARPGAEAGATSPAPTLENLQQIVPRLHSANPDEVREAIDLLSVIDRREVIPPLAELLRSGQSDAITDRALEALRGLADPSAVDVLVEFSRHRRAAARRRAYHALSAIRDPRVPALLEQGLRDSDRTVRAQCATALGAIGANGSVDVLFRAFDRGVVEAAASLGKLGDGASVSRFTAHLGQQPLSVMLSGYEQYLRRSDIDEATKVQIVTRLGEVSGRAVREFLAQYLAQMPAAPAARRPAPRRPSGETAEERRSLREVVEDTIRRIPVEGDTRRTTTVGAPTAGGAQ